VKGIREKKWCDYFDNKARRQWETARRSPSFIKFLEQRGIENKEIKGKPLSRIPFEEIKKHFGRDFVIEKLICFNKSVSILDGSSPQKVIVELDLNYSNEIILKEISDTLTTGRKIVGISNKGIVKGPRGNKKWRHFDECLKAYELTTSGIDSKKASEMLFPRLKTKTALRRLERDKKLFFKMIEEWRHM